MAGGTVIAAYRFIHAADIHLDSPLRSLALRDAELAGLIGHATRTAFTRIIDLALAEQVDALIIAGDLYDGEQTSMKTARFLAGELRKLDEAGIDVFIIRGNHDALSRITQELVFPDRVRLFGARAEAVPVLRGAGEVPVVMHGLSFAKPAAPDGLLPRYKPPVTDAVNIGIMHTSLGGAPGHDVYAPCSLIELQQSGFRYWGLGHIHQRAAHEGAATVVMAGMPQGRDINEAGPKSVSLVTIGDDRSVTVEERLTSVAEFRRVRVDVSGIDAWEDLVAALGEGLAGARAAVASDHLVARVSLVGTTPLAWRMRRDADSILKTEADDKAARLGGAHVEKLEIAVTSPAAGASEAADPIVELQRLINSDVLGSDAFHRELASAAAQLTKQLPRELRDLLGADEAAVNATLEMLAQTGVDDVLARLQPDGAKDTA